MTEPLQVGQFAIVDGEPVDRGPNAGVFHGKGPTDDRAELFVLAEGTTPAGEAFAGHVVSALGQAFGSLDMSLTGSLTRLFLEAERNLLDWNRKSIAQHRVAVGLSAFGRRGEQAVIAQAGPSVAFHLHEGRVTAHYPEGESARPIGSAPVQPQLTRIPFEQGDRLLLISSRALDDMDGELVSGILALPEHQVLPDLYRRVQQLRQVTVILVTGPQPGRARGRAARPERAEAAESDYVIGAEDAEHAALTGEFQPSLFIDDGAEAVVRSARAHLAEVQPRRAIGVAVPALMLDVPEPLLRASGESASEMNRLAAEGAARAARSRAAVATIEAELPRIAPRPNWRSPDHEHVAFAPRNNQGEGAGGNLHRVRKNQSFSRGLVSNGTPATRPELLTEDIPLLEDLTATVSPRASLLSPVSETLAAENGQAISGGAPLIRPRTNMGGRWKGGNAFGRRSAVGGQLPPTWLVILGTLVVLIVLAGALTVPRLISGDDSERLANLLDGAQQRILASGNATDSTQKRQLLTEAQGMLLEARDIEASAQTEQLIGQVTAVIAGMDNIQQPQAVEAVASLAQFGTRPVAVARMAIGSDSAYLLDGNSSQVVAVSLNGAEPRVVFAENKDEKRAKPVAIAQLDTSELGGPVLLIADANRHLYAFSETSGLRAIAFAAPNNLTITDIATRGRDLFVLDAGASVIYQFLQTPQGFPNAPLKSVQSADLGAARRLMVDAEFITSDANGNVHRFLNGGNTAITFSEAGIDQRLVAPETAQPFGDEQVAILDAPNDRIVVLRRDGAFDHQYRHADFAGASAFAIKDGVAYVFSGSQLRRVTF